VWSSRALWRHSGLPNEVRGVTYGKATRKNHCEGGGVNCASKELGLRGLQIKAFKEGEGA